jgi:signal transduction histidine kinase
LLDEVHKAWQHDNGRGAREVRISGGDDVRGQVPPLALAQVFLSLLDNADEAAPPGTPIEVELASKGDQVVISFSDRGPGIAGCVRRHFGEPFVTTKPQGTGLGLYNALTLAQALGGDLTVGDRPGGGAVASISLPIMT